MHSAQLRNCLFARHNAAPWRNLCGPVAATKDAAIRRPIDLGSVTRHPFFFAFRLRPRCVPYRRFTPHRPRMIKLNAASVFEAPRLRRHCTSRHRHRHRGHNKRQLVRSYCVLRGRRASRCQVFQASPHDRAHIRPLRERPFDNPVDRPVLLFAAFGSVGAGWSSPVARQAHNLNGREE